MGECNNKKKWGRRKVRIWVNCSDTEKNLWKRKNIRFLNWRVGLYEIRWMSRESGSSQKKT